MREFVCVCMCVSFSPVLCTLVLYRSISLSLSLFSFLTIPFSSSLFSSLCLSPLKLPKRRHLDLSPGPLPVCHVMSEMNIDVCSNIQFLLMLHFCASSRLPLKCNWTSHMIAQCRGATLQQIFEQSLDCGHVIASCNTCLHKLGGRGCWRRSGDRVSTCLKWDL